MREKVMSSKASKPPGQAKKGATISFVFGSEYYDFSWPLMSGSQLPMGERGPIVSPIPSPQNTKMGAMERSKRLDFRNVGHTTQAHAIHASCCVCVCEREREREREIFNPSPS